jgi:hypothetical protein
MLICARFTIIIHNIRYSNRWNEVIDTRHDQVSKDLGQIADTMYEWEGPVAEQLDLTRADIAAIKVKYPIDLKLQT